MLVNGKQSNFDDLSWFPLDGNKYFIRLSLFAAPILMMIVMFLTKLSWSLHHWLLTEDSVIETSTAIIYFIACLFGFWMCRQLWKRYRLISVLYFMLSIFFFIVCMEEISWGQRIVDLKILHFIVQNNVQGETTFHNLPVWQTDRSGTSHYYSLSLKLSILIGFYGAFSWLLVPMSLKNRYKFIVDLLAPTPLLTFYFLPTVLVGIVFVYFKGQIGPISLSNRASEFAEFLLSLGFLLFVTMNILKERHYSQHQQFLTY